MTTELTLSDVTVTIPALGDAANIVTAFTDYHTDMAAAVAVLARSTNTFTGDVAVNGGDITTTATTATLFNANATTLSFGGAAATLTIGATTGTATIRNATVAITNAATIGTTLGVTGNTTLTGNLAVNGGALTSSASTFNLLASPNTVNIAAGGTAVSIGATTGTTTVNNDLLLNTGKTIIFEGATTNDYETILTVVDPTSSDKTITLPNATGYVALTSATDGRITLGTDTTGNYVATITASGSGITIGNSGTENAAVTIANSGVTSIAGTANEITASANTGAVTLSLPATISADLSGTASKATSLAAGTAGAIPYQTGIGATGYSAAGSPGQFLTSNGTSAPTWTTYSDTYPTAMSYAGGTSAGPVATITGTNFMSFAASAIPSAATDASGIVTNQAQSFGGKKTFGNGIAVENGGAFEYYGYSTTSGTSTLTNVPGTVSYATNQPSILTSVLTANAATNTGSVGAEFRASGTTTTHLITFSSGTTARGSISTNSTTTTYSTSSDYRLKENIQPIVNATDRLMLLKPSRFNFIEFPDKVVDGFIAHEAQEVVPESVVGNKDDVNEDGSPAYQGIDQSKLVPLLTAALQESIAKIEELTSRIEALEA